MTPLNRPDSWWRFDASNESMDVTYGPDKALFRSSLLSACFYMMCLAAGAYLVSPEMWRIYWFAIVLVYGTGLFFSISSLFDAFRALRVFELKNDVLSVMFPFGFFRKHFHLDNCRINFRQGNSGGMEEEIRIEDSEGCFLLIRQSLPGYEQFRQQLEQTRNGAAAAERCRRELRRMLGNGITLALKYRQHMWWMAPVCFVFCSVVSLASILTMLEDGVTSRSLFEALFFGLFAALSPYYFYCFFVTIELRNGVVSKRTPWAVKSMALSDLSVVKHCPIGQKLVSRNEEKIILNSGFEGQHDVTYLLRSLLMGRLEEPQASKSES